MDLSALPNNNHPDKFLQLDVKLLMRNSALLQGGLVRFPGGNFPAAQNWKNLVYSQVPFGGTRAWGGDSFLSCSGPGSMWQKEDCREQRTNRVATLASGKRPFFLRIRGFLSSLYNRSEFSHPFISLQHCLPSTSSL